MMVEAEIAKFPGDAVTFTSIRPDEASVHRAAGRGGALRRPASAARDGEDATAKPLLFVAGQPGRVRASASMQADSSQVSAVITVRG